MKTSPDTTKFVLTLYNKTYAIALNFGYDTCQIKVGIVQVNAKGQMSNCYFMLFHALAIKTIMIIVIIIVIRDFLLSHWQS